MEFEIHRNIFRDVIIKDGTTIMHLSTNNKLFKRSNRTGEFRSGSDRTEVFSIKINNRRAERQTEKFSKEVTIPSLLSKDVNILPNAVPSA